VVWITLVVSVMVICMYFAVREIEQELLRQSYDQFLRESLEDVHATMARLENASRNTLVAELTERVRANENRAWFLRVYDANKAPIFNSVNAPMLAKPTFPDDVKGPYDEALHRVIEKKFHKPSGEAYYVRCGFLQSALQADIDLLNRYMILASISIMFAAPLGGYIIALRATRPIARIIATAAVLQPSNLNERLPIRGAGDEIDQLSRTINGMLDRIASFIDQNRDFVANAAHELRSPLTAIRSSVEVGLNRSRTPEEYASILSDVMEEISRLAGLINCLLILAEGDAGRLARTDQVTRLDKLVRETVDMFEAVAELKGIQWTVGELIPVTVPGDETYLRQVLRNLIDNAIKYNRDGGEVSVHLSPDPVQKQAVLIVKDTGAGIDPEVLPRIFERFYRADPARTRATEPTGHGLGLSICLTVVRALHGEITVDSESGRGTTFTVKLPLRESASPNTTEEKQIPLPTGS
jgi:signal transduction histidine kinase